MNLPTLNSFNFPPVVKTMILWIGGTLLIAAAYRAYEWKGRRPCRHRLSLLGDAALYKVGSGLEACR